MGKGSRRREEDQQKIEANWEKVFPPKRKPPEVQQDVPPEGAKLTIAQMNL